MTVEYRCTNCDATHYYRSYNDPPSRKACDVCNYRAAVLVRG